MKTALLLTNSGETQRLLTEILGQKTNFVLLPAPPDPSREKFDAIFATWLRLVDAVILDAASLGATARWALESLQTAKLQEHQAVVVRTTAEQKSLYPVATNWLIISDQDSPDQLRQSLATLFELRETQAKLKRADAVIARQRQATGATSSAPTVPAPRPAAPLAQPAYGNPGGSVEFYRYRAALKNLSQLFHRRGDEQAWWASAVEAIRELLGVGKIAIFYRPSPAKLFDEAAAAGESQFSVAASTGIAFDVAKHLRLSLEGGIAGCLVREARILRRAQAADPAAWDYDAQIAREFELLGTDVAVPMFENEHLLGVLTFSGKITGEPLTNDELELAYHVMAQLAQALRNFQLADQIAAQQKLLSEVLANVQSGVVVVDHAGRILNINRRASELLEIAGADLTGQNLNRLPGRVADILFEAAKTGAEIRQREVTVPRGHRPLGVSAARFAMQVAAGAPQLVVVGMIEDLTEVKLQQSRAREQADREFFTRLAARMSHELKNSLVSIKIFAQLLPERYNEKEFREQFSTTVTNEVNRVDVLVNNLTFFAHPLQLVCEELVLTDLIETCLKNVTQEFARKRVAHIINVGEQPPADAGETPVVTVKRNLGHKAARLEGDRIRLMQALEHVLRNAVQSTPAGGRLTVSTADAQAGDFGSAPLPAGGAVRIECQDSGEGIALEDLRRVTDPFFTTRNVGVGLGLTIVKKIAERHSGRLEIDSLLGKGTKVVMVLPLKAQPHPDDELLGEIDRAARAQEQETVRGMNRVEKRVEKEREQRREN